MQKVITYLLLMLSSALAAQPPGEDTTKWKVVFADEFTGNRLDRTKWDIGWPWGQSPFITVPICNWQQPNQINEPQAWVNFKNDTHNIKVNEGTIKLYTLEEDVEGEFWDWDEGYFRVTKKPVSHTTGLIFSKQQYYRGYYEIRFKLPKAPKFPMTYAPFGPDFWIYSGKEPGKPGCYSEIDGFEFINGQARTITSNIHYMVPPSGIGADTICKGTTTDDYFIYKSVEDGVWHTFGFNWTGDNIKFYLDGVNYFTSRTQHVDSLKAMNIIAGIASPVSMTCVGLNGLFTKFPYTFEVDYIRVWQRKEE